MSYAQEMQDAAAEAQGILAQIQGMAATAAGNFIGPDGRPYTLVFRAADALESHAALSEMSSHGYGDKSLVIATATRDQFTADPLGWRRQKATRLTPRAEVLILSVATDDPLHYVFNLVVRQEATPNG